MNKSQSFGTLELIPKNSCSSHSQTPCTNVQADGIRHGGDAEDRLYCAVQLETAVSGNPNKKKLVYALQKEASDEPLGLWDRLMDELYVTGDKVPYSR